MRKNNQIAHRGFAQRVNETQGNRLLIALSTLLIAFFLATQVLPYVVTFADDQVVINLDFEDSDSEEDNLEEVAIGEKNLEHLTTLAALHRDLKSHLRAEHQRPLPATPFLETISPPPDQL